MDKKALNLLVVSVFVLVVGVVGVGVALQRSAASGLDCTHATNIRHYRVSVKDGTATPRHTSGKLCDTLTITNQDMQTREMAFGPHEDHVPYDGVAEKSLPASKSFTVTLNQVGTFHFHDHIHDDAEGYFNVYE